MQRGQSLAVNISPQIIFVVNGSYGDLCESDLFSLFYSFLLENICLYTCVSAFVWACLNI